MKLKIVENFLENEDINELKSLKLKKIKENNTNTIEIII